MAFPSLEYLTWTSADEGITACLLGGGGLEEERVFGFRGGGDFEVCGRWSDEVGGDLGIDWDEVWWVGLGCAVRQEIVDRREGWLELVLLGLSIMYDDNLLGTAYSTYSVRHFCFNIEI